MIKNIAFLLLTIFLVFSCSDDDQNANEIAVGQYIELSPIENRTILIFSENNQLEELRTTENGIPIKSTYTIRFLTNSRIELSSNEADEAFPRVFEFNRLSDDRFEIETINPSDPVETTMLFERL